MRSAILGALLVLPFAGCLEIGLLGQPETDQITVPVLHLGRVWRYDDQSSPREISQQPALELDARGRPVEAIRLGANVTTDRFDGSIIALGQGLVLTDGFHGHHIGYGCKGADQRSVQGRVYDQYPIYNTEPLHHSWGTVLGTTLRPHQTYVYHQNRTDGAASEWRLTRTVTVEAFQDLRVTLNGVEQTLRTAPVLMRDSVTWRHGEKAGDHRHEQRVHFADGIGVPVQLGGSYGNPGRSLAEYREGSARVPFRDALETTQFDPRMDGVKTSKIAITPDLSGLGLEFPVDEALQQIRLGPRSAPATVWLLQHPDAYARHAEYWRDPAAQVYKWSFWFTTGKEDMTADVVREPGPSGPQYSSTSPLFASGPKGPDGAQVRRIGFIDAGAAFEVAKAFQPNLTEWRYFAFHTRGRVPLAHVGSGGEGSYAFAVLNTKFTDPHSDIKVEYYAPGRSVDATTGRLLGGAQDAQCGFPRTGPLFGLHLWS